MAMRAGGEILASAGIREAYTTGRGPVTVRGRAFIEGAESPAPPSSSSPGGVPQRGFFCLIPSFLTTPATPAPRGRAVWVSEGAAVDGCPDATPGLRTCHKRGAGQAHACTLRDQSMA